MKKLFQNVVVPALNCGLNSLICVVCVFGWLMIFTSDTTNESVEQILKLGSIFALFVIMASAIPCYLYWKRNGKPFKFSIFDIIDWI